MFNRIMILALAVSISLAAPGGAGAEGLEDDGELLEGLDEALIFSGIMLATIDLTVTLYNRDGLASGDPSRLGGVGGVLLGTSCMLYGAASVFVDEPAMYMTGLGCMTVGTLSVYYGVRTLAEVRREYFEEKERGLSVAPALIGGGTGRPAPGIQVSWKF